MSEAKEKFKEKLKDVFKAHREAVRQSLDDVVDVMRPRPMTWADVSKAVDAAIPILAGELSEGAVQRRVAEDFLARFKDHAEERSAEDYDGAPFTIRGSSLFDLFAHQLGILGSNHLKIANDVAEKKRVTGNLQAVLSALRKVPSAVVKIGKREYAVFLEIPEVGGGRGSHPYTASMQIQAGRDFQGAGTEMLKRERSQFYKIFADHWFSGGIAWDRVGTAFGPWLRLALEDYDPERVIYVLTELMETMDYSDRVMFLNGLSGFDVDPFLVHDETFAADYLLAAWHNCGGEALATDADTLSILRKLRDHEALLMIEKVVALRILRMSGAEVFEAVQPFPRDPTSSAEAKELLQWSSAEAVFAPRIDLREWMREAEDWLREAAEGKAHEVE
jgi:hypothetical protein